MAKQDDSKARENIAAEAKKLRALTAELIAERQEREARAFKIARGGK